MLICALVHIRALVHGLAVLIRAPVGPPDFFLLILINPLRNSEHFQNLLRFIMFGYCLLGVLWN